MFARYSSLDRFATRLILCMLKTSSAMYVKESLTMLVVVWSNYMIWVTLLLISSQPFSVLSKTMRCPSIWSWNLWRYDFMAFFLTLSISCLLQCQTWLDFHVDRKLGLHIWESVMELAHIFSYEDFWLSSLLSMKQPKQPDDEPQLDNRSSFLFSATILGDALVFICRFR